LFQRLKPKCDKPPSKFAFNFNLRRYIKAVAVGDMVYLIGGMDSTGGKA